MADDLRVRIVWQNDEASLRAAMQQAQQRLQTIQGNVGYGDPGTVAGAATPASIQAQGGIRAQAPTGILNAQGQPVGTTTSTIVAPPPTYNMTASSGTGTSYAAQGNQAAVNQPGPFSGNRPSSGLARLSGPLGYAGRSIAIKGIFGALGAIGEAAEQQQQLSDLNRRVGSGVQQWREFEDSILKVGVGLGATRQQMIELTNTFVSSVGRMGTQQTADTVRGGMLLAKTMGISPESVVGFESNTARFLQGPNTDFGKLGATLYTAVSKGMQGREEEVIKAIENLTEIVGNRLPDLGPEGIGGITTLLGALSSTGVQGFMGQRGAQVAGTLDSFISGGGSDVQKMIAWTTVARQRQKAGLPTSVVDIGLQMEGGVNDKGNLQAIKELIKSLPQGQGGVLALAGMTGLSLNQAKQMIETGAMSNMDVAGGLKTPPGVQLTQADRNTELMVDAGRAMTELGEKLVTVVAPIMNVLAHNIGMLTAIIGASNLLGLNPLGAAAGVGAAGRTALGTLTGVGGTGVAATGMGLGLAGGAGLLLGGLLSMGYDKLAHPGEPTTIDMLLQMMGVDTRGVGGQVAHHAGGGIVTRPEVATLGENGPEAVIPLDRNNKAALRAVARQIAAAYGLDPNIFERQINQESGFNYQALGDSGGSYGLGQINRSSHPDFFAEGDPYDPVKNLTYSAAFDARLLAKYGNMRDALAAYNAGGGNIGAGYGYADKILGGTNVFSPGGGQTVNHELNVNIKQADGSVERFKKSLTDRSAVTSPNWGVSY